jgi:hypothetical protein
MTALKLGKKLGLAMPRKIAIFAIEVEDTVNFREECTPAVAAAIPVCVGMVMQELKD